MIDIFPRKYRTMQQRFLYVVFMRYGTLVKVARILGITKQFIYIILKNAQCPIEYASYLGDRNELCPGLFNYGTYVLVRGQKALTYEKLLNIHADWFTDDEYEYILKGTPPFDPIKILNSTWKKALTKK